MLTVCGVILIGTGVFTGVRLKEYLAGSLLCLAGASVCFFTAFIAAQ